MCKQDARGLRVLCTLVEENEAIVTQHEPLPSPLATACTADAAAAAAEAADTAADGKAAEGARGVREAFHARAHDSLNRAVGPQTRIDPSVLEEPLLAHQPLGRHWWRGPATSASRRWGSRVRLVTRVRVAGGPSAGAAAAPRITQPRTRGETVQPLPLVYEPRDTCLLALDGRSPLERLLIRLRVKVVPEEAGNPTARHQRSGTQRHSVALSGTRRLSAALRGTRRHRGTERHSRGARTADHMGRRARGSPSRRRRRWFAP